jgi:hypothetical protein
MSNLVLPNDEKKKNISVGWFGFVGTGCLLRGQ